MAGGIIYNSIVGDHRISGLEKSTNEVASGAGEISARRIKVEASGAVEKPGVYDMPYDSRVKDVLISAGGLVSKADRNYISKNINLAQRVVDGGKIYFPFEGESGQKVVGSLININLATEAQLDSLPGIGLATASKIVAGRPYQSISELVSKKIISNSVFQKIKDKIAVN